MKAPPRPRALLCDLGDTLLVEQSYDMNAGVKALFAHIGAPGDDIAALAADLSENARRVRQEGYREFYFLRWIGERLRALGSDADPEEVEREVWTATVTLAPLARVAEGLGRARAAGLRLAVVSNAIFSSGALRAELDRQGLLDCFEFVISSADHGIRKPDASIFREALARIACPAEDTWFVGDSFENDVVGASALGMSALWLSRGPAPDAKPRPAHWQISDWGELIALLEAAA